MKKQDWTPREEGRPFLKLLEDPRQGEWWNALADQRRAQGADRFREWLTRRLRHSNFRFQVIRRIHGRFALPTRKQPQTAEEVAWVVIRILDFPKPGEKP